MNVVVANPSSTGEMVAAAGGLGRAQMLTRYHVPVALEPAQEQALRRLPSWIHSPILRELRRRPVPSDVPAGAVRRTAALSDVARVAMQRAPGVPLRMKSQAGMLHARWFDRQVSGCLGSTDGQLLAVAGEGTQHTLKRAGALGIETWLDFPLPDLASVLAILRDEAQRVPEYASTMFLADAWHQKQWQWLVDETHGQALAADHLLVLSSYARDTFLDAGVPAEKMHLTPLGTDTELFRPAPRPDDGIFRILFVGQISQRKGVSYLVDAFRAAAIPGSELVLAGQIIGAAPWAGVTGIRHQRPLPRRDLAAVYASADVVVLPSLAEGFPIAPMEAMASGRPVIVSRHTFGSDVISDGVDGWTVPIRDANAIAERLRLLATDPDLRRRMGVAARRTAERFTWTNYGDALAKLMSGAR